MRLLRSPDAPETTEPSPAPSAAPPTSAEVIAKGKKTKKDVPLEIRVSELEDDNKTLKDRNLELENLFNAARTAPSPARKDKSLLDELNEFLGL